MKPEEYLEEAVRQEARVQTWMENSVLIEPLGRGES
jgi:hypothetical protein